MKFYANEILNRLIIKLPENIVTFLCFAAAVVLWNHIDTLNEVERRVLGGLVSSYVFYIFIQVIPKIGEKKKKLSRVLAQTGQTKQLLNHTLHLLKEEAAAAGWPLANSPNSDFFNLLNAQTITYMPTTVQLQIITRTTGSPLKTFVYGNLGDVLLSHSDRIKRSIAELQGISSIYGIEGVEPKISEKIFDLASFDMNIPNLLARMQHIGNTAAPIGTELDVISGKLNGIQEDIANQLK